MRGKRIDMVDALRGFALLGLFIVHCVERFELYWLDPRPDGWFDAVFAIFAGKAFAIFALLFGFSFAPRFPLRPARMALARGHAHHARRAVPPPP